MMIVTLAKVLQRLDFPFFLVPDHKSTCNSHAHEFYFYLFQLPLDLERPLDYGTTDRILNPLHVGVHVVQSQHLVSARDPVHWMLRHVWVFFFPGSFVMPQTRRFPQMSLSGLAPETKDVASNERAVRGLMLDRIRLYQLLPVVGSQTGACLLSLQASMTSPGPVGV